MFYNVKKYMIALLAVSVLFGLTACGTVPARNAPSMVDYSYVPQQSSQLSVISTPGIEAY
jgi:starvation-inducible outer membrane lipoprotein